MTEKLDCSLLCLFLRISHVFQTGVRVRVRLKKAGVSCQTGAKISGKFHEMLKLLQRQMPSYTAIMPPPSNELSLSPPDNEHHVVYSDTTPLPWQKCNHCSRYGTPTASCLEAPPKTKTPAISRGEILKQLIETVTNQWTLGHLF